MKDSTIVVESVRKLLRRGATVHLLNMLVKVRPADLAEAFKSLDGEEKSAAFRLLAERASPQAAALLGLMHAATIMARGLSTGRISLRLVGGVIFKEIRIALPLGMIYGALLGVAAVLLVRLSPAEGLPVGLSLWLSMGMAAVLGAVLSMILKTIRVDPAVATSPFVTTAVDLLGLLPFFGVAGPHLVAQ